MSESTVTLAQAVTVEAIITQARSTGLTSLFTQAEPATKRAVRKALTESIKEALRGKKFEEAGELSDLDEVFEAVKINKTAESPKIDFTQVLADKINSYKVAAIMLAEFGAVLPGVSEIDAERLATLTSGEASVEAVLAGISLAESVKISATVRSTERTDLAAHLAEVIADVEPGTFLKISEVAKVRTAAAPNGLPSQGALAARLFAEGGCTLDGVEPVEATSSTPKGLRVL